MSRFNGPAQRPLLVFTRDERSVGLLVNEIVDIVESEVDTDMTAGGAGSQGGLIIGGVATELIDVSYYWSRAFPEEATGGSAERAAVTPSAPLTAAAEEKAPAAALSKRRLLLVDQSPFSQLLLKPLLAQAGYEVVVAEDPVAALGLYDAGEQFQLIMADTSSPESARQLAATLNRAAGWHKTPLLSLAIHNTMTTGGTGGMAPSTLLDAVSGALSELKGAA
ncbi:MAG: hypothetical protein Q8M65_07750 [Rhodoglobus sp.]|nr:hypothetical protein [Rhodoglobus sp.]